MINRKYKIKKLLGKGRSTVYLGDDADSPGKDIAIKILPADVDKRELKFFRDEFFTLHKLHHPNIINSYKLGTILENDSSFKEILIGSKFFTLEYFNGNRLLEYSSLKDERKLRNIIKQICSVLYYLHLSNYIYYDLKPENILVADINGEPSIKLIDLGFAQYTVDNGENIIRGSAEYLAPEILKNQKHDHRVDLYSLGIILYRIIYGRFPFETGNELEIYKAHVENEFEFQASELSPKLIAVIEKLLMKDPEERYSNVVQILFDLDIPVDESLTKDWLPAKVFADRKDSLTILKTYISDNTSSEVFTIRGTEGSGKTTLAYELYAEQAKCIFVENDVSFTGADFIKLFLDKIIFNEFVYSNLPFGMTDRIEKVTGEKSSELLDNIKSIFNEITDRNKFIIILDSFNLYNSFAIEFFKTIIPIFQVNKIKVILTENTDRPFITDFIFNLREVNLSPFTEIHLNEYLEKSYSSLFPKEDLRKLILTYADLLPGNLESFIKDIILLKIISFTLDGIKISTDADTVSLLKSSHEEIYVLRFKSLRDIEKYAAQFISAFEITTELKTAAGFLRISPEETAFVFSQLEQKNIIHPVQQNEKPLFVSEGLKRYVYSTISDKKNYHFLVANYIKHNFIDFNKLELARQFELAGDYNSSSMILQEEAMGAETISAYSYEKNILQKMTAFPLDKSEAARIKYELANIHYKLSEFKDALNLLHELHNEGKNIENEKLQLILEGRSLIGLTEYEQGKRILEPLINEMENKNIRQQLQIDLATVEFNLNQYERSIDICKKIIEDKSGTTEEMGQIYEMLGLISLYKDNDTDEALKYFQQGNKIFEKAGLKFGVAQMLMDIGNIYSMKGDNKNAYLYWNKSLEINHSIGNIDQEAKLYLNLGVFYYDSLNFEKSIESYQKSLSIFTTLGNRKGIGLVQTNLGEIYTLICEYQKALDSLSSAISIFEKLQNVEEILEALVIYGKMDFIIGDYEGLNSIIIKYEAASSSIELSARYKTYFSLLNLLNTYPSNEFSAIIGSLDEMKEIFLSLEMRNDYFLCVMLKVKAYMRMGKNENAFEELHHDELKYLCSTNMLYEGERNYIKGLILESDPSIDNKSFVDYYLSAYEMISGSYVTDLAWKILFSLAKIYSDRNNFSKAAEFIKYSESLINFTAGNIKNPRLRNIYLNQKERKEALDKLRQLHSKFL